MKYLLLITAVLFCQFRLFSQPQINNWFFTGNNGLNFSSGSPVNIPGGQIIVMEGASAVSNKYGQLLFYTDGIKVWNKYHLIMSNGESLAGGSGSSTQSCIIVPKTHDEKEYYIFTTDEEGGVKGLQYSIVDMSLNGGWGGVTIKNQPLVTPSSEKVTAVRHCNKKDYWVITHKYGSDAYYAYLTTENGVDPNPVISNTGKFVPVTYGTMAGALRSSSDGKKLVAVHPTIGVELSNFNNQTGVVSNTNEIFKNDNAHHYGAEFSLSSKMLYVSIHGYWDDVDIARYSGVFQFNLSLLALQDIINSKFEVFRYNPISEVGTLQRGPDGKIYMSQFFKPYLSVINLPEIYGAGCNFIDIGVPLPAPAKGSLPNFINDYSSTEDSFRVNSTAICVNVPVNFEYTVGGDATALLWNFGDPSSGSLNNSTIDDPLHTFSLPGTFTVTLIKYSPCGNDTLTKNLSVGDLQVNLGRDTIICEGSQYLLSPHSAGPGRYLWQDGSVGPTYPASLAGLYWVQVSNDANSCSRKDSIVITTKPLAVFDLGADDSLCPGTSLMLNAFYPGAQYTWQDNSTNPSFLANNPGSYSVAVNLNGCTKKDSINITGLSKPQFSLGPDQFLCPGLSLLLAPGLGNVTYKWQDGTTDNKFLIQTTGLYYVDISNKCGTSTDSINILTGNCTIYIPSAFTPNDDGLNDRFQVMGTGLVNEFDLKIFDRSGQLIFQTRDKNGYWNGQYKGINMPFGVYIYMINYSEANIVEKKLLKGTILLIR